ncbi:MAG: hypothetical protein WCT20_02200, partial [Candidatus Babeliales bacterium]
MKIISYATLIISIISVVTTIAKSDTKQFDAASVSKKYFLSQEKVANSLNLAHESMQPKMKPCEVTCGNNTVAYEITRQGVGLLETPYGEFYLFDFKVNDTWEHYFALVKAQLNSDFMPEFKNSKSVTLRIDSGCLTGQLFNDRTCECKAQLELAMKDISEIGEGLVICIPTQDGRGMGLPFKLA